MNIGVLSQGLLSRIVFYVATFKNTYALFLWLTPPWFGMKDDQDQEIRMSTGSNAFSLFICLDSNKFVLLSFFSVMTTIYLRVWTKPLTNDTKSPLSVWHPSNFDLLMKFIIPFSYLYFESVYRQNQTETEPSFHFHGESVVKCIYK